MKFVSVCLVLLSFCWTCHGSVNYKITQTWNGVSVPEADQVTLTIQEVTNSIRIDISAPYKGGVGPTTDQQRTQLWNYESVEVFFSNCLYQLIQVIVTPQGDSLVILYNGVGNNMNRHATAGHTVETSATIDGSRWTGQITIPAAYFPKLATLFNAACSSGVGTPSYRLMSLFPSPASATRANSLDLSNYQNLPCKQTSSCSSIFTSLHYSATWKTLLAL